MRGLNSTQSKLIAWGLLVVGIVGHALLGFSASAATLRVKDISRVKGVRNNQLVGYGLVVGLSKTGDKSRSTQTSTANLINNFNGRLNNDNDIRSTNTAAVIVTAIVPPFAKEGDPLDVMVSSMADAASLEGGVLVNTELRAPNGEVVALAQGPLSTGGTSVSASGSSKRTAITTSARIPNGAIMEREIHTDIGDENGMDLVLNRTDFTLASRVAESITKSVAPARAIDGSTVRVLFPDQFIDNRVAFLSRVENVTVNATEEVAKVVINERTGTIVIGNNVKLLPAAVAHGGITVSVSTENSVSQPDSFSPGGQTVGISNSKISIDKAQGSLVKLGANATLQDLVAALNALGVTPSDLISVLQALKASGSLEATLEII
ncbi:flagellar basal body P-ring protein FlgI [Vampirovibrio chlorellavorus]|uniref:flagellar basal body P-ring protein FlgI n=1 Tax=Vampirovibrio chlorellavorus TaxID=758823 RepID=UPI0026E9791E|nr:flagellar basal body P-ring protein FlgI [Vampirovibrio chlorellavorus]